MAIANSHLEPEHIASINQAIETVKQETGRTVAFPDKRKRRWAEKLSEEFRRGGSRRIIRDFAGDGCASRAGSRGDSQVARASADLDRRKNQRGREDIVEAGGTEAYFGDPRSASREEGEAMYEALSDMVVSA